MSAISKSRVSPGGTATPTRQEPAPVLITEQQVMFGTAVAGSAPRPRTGNRTARVLRQLLWALPAPPLPRPHYASRNDYLERSRMAREMYRL